MTDAKLGQLGRPRRFNTGPITPLSPEGEDGRAREDEQVGDGQSGDGATLSWRSAAPRDDESVRWAHADGRWIAVGLGSGAHTGSAFVRSSTGRCEYLDSYEAALALAREWQTA